MNEFDFDQLFQNAQIQLEVLKKDILYILDLYYKKPFILDCRIKSKEKLILKQKLLQKKYNRNIDIYSLADIIGIRISVDTEKDVLEVGDLIYKTYNPDWSKDYIKEPSVLGFKALSYYFEHFGINTEIQVMTKEMMRWTNNTHKEYDEEKYKCLK